MTEPPLIGREPECQLLDALVESVSTGLSGSLVFLGEPGVGKTRLLEHLTESPAQIIRLVGIESEFSIGFGALHRLLLPFREHFADVPVPQHNALLTTFGALDEPPPPRFVLGLAALSVLAAAARAGPLICVIDDAQWLDQESLEVLSFVARRVYADSLGFVFAGREHYDALEALHGLPTHHVLGLARKASHSLLQSVRPGAVSSSVAARIVAETDGNPLAMLELLNQLTSEQLAGRLPLPQQLPTGRGLTAHFLRQLEVLSPETRSLLVLASAMSTDDPSTLWRAAALLGIPHDAADGAHDLDVLSIGDTVTFRHPLIRSAVYHAAEPRQRRLAHSVMATIAEMDDHADLAAWHRAAATSAPDEDVAADLERSAERAERRGGQLARARFLARAAELSPAPEERSDRMFGAAEAYLAAGDGILAEALLDKVAPRLEADGRHVDVQRMRALLAMFHHRHRDAWTILLEAIGSADPFDEDLIRGMMFEALRAALGARDDTDRVTAEEIARTVIDYLRDKEPPVSARDMLLEGLASRFALGYSQAVPLLRDSVRALFADGNEPLDAHSSPVAGWFAADEIWDDDGRRALFERGVEAGRRHGVLSVLQVSLAGQCVSHCWAGEMAAAERSCFEAVEITALMGLPRPVGLGPAIHLRAWQGREQECREHAREAAAWGAQWGSLYLEMYAWSGLTVLEMGLGNYTEALGLALAISERDTLGFGSTILPEVVEAATRAGEPEAAATALAKLEERAEASATPWALGMLARSRAILAHDSDAERLYLRSIELLLQTSLRVEVARTQLLYGQWLRRQRRRRDAQVQLSTAHHFFETTGVGAFAARAGSELLATGLKTVQVTGRGRADPGLTPQEAQVARLAATGATNSEIAVQMFLTTSTVEYHLSKVFKKLNITSRRQLGHVMQ
ncbi:LuxR C-terminal-related transcriptional regulator [Herbiconiux sp. CPCC 205763]|uniref:LuxR C-terminal-related transcriptional regulator n=1 Tax=Herbiconiux aconitum TaxID=2970913 RepID=A0ABT2GNG6_9MICO|nr:LuxR family transcriptional regulator [Herbiconiux aconitum]MCS5717762.1 LuxR C-terminal-related transcriptional regulator [Herbiconiux aconitum]